MAWTSTPAASRPRRVTGLPSATTTTPGRTASTLQPRVGYSSSGTSTSRIPSSRSHSQRPGRQQRQEHDREVVADRRDHRHQVDELRRALPVRDVDDPDVAADEGRQLPRTERRSSGASGRSRRGRRGARRCRRPRRSRAPRSGRRSGRRVRPSQSARTSGSSARFGLPGRSGIAPSAIDEERVEDVAEIGIRRRLDVEGVDADAEAVEGRDEPVVLALGGVARSHGQRKPWAGSSKARPKAGPGA